MTTKNNLSNTSLTEAEVAHLAKETLGLYNTSSAKADMGQTTTFNELGFRGVIKKPDGWYLPCDVTCPALIVEVKSSKTNIEKYIDEILRNCEIAGGKYNRVIGIIWNGYDLIVFKNGERIDDIPNELQPKEYYFRLFDPNTIDKQAIYRATKAINDTLHFDLILNSLYHRMIFTACALVAIRYGATLSPNMGYKQLRASISERLSIALEGDLRINHKLYSLIKIFESIEVGNPKNEKAIEIFVTQLNSISDHIKSDYWNGEDVMAIFFNEFNRYKGRTESGQVFTPDHITSLMYRILEVSDNDRVLDAACGSGAFLVKAMCNMIKSAGGVNSPKATQIKQEQLFGIELCEEVFALACANMLIHKDGKSNITRLDSRTQEAFEWIRSKEITKVLMNPPFEQKYGCLTIVENVLNAVACPLDDKAPKRNILCGFILPDDKLEKRKGQANRILRNHSLLKIIKLPEKLFPNGTKTSIYVFMSGVPHGSQQNKDILGYYIAEDGFETVKNQGRHDIYDKWQTIENEWVDVIVKQENDKHNSKRWIDPNTALRYIVPDNPFQIDATDFKKVVLEYVLYQSQIDATDFKIIIKDI